MGHENFLRDVENEIGTESVEGVVISDPPWQRKAQFNECPLDKLISFDEARPWLDYSDYHSGFGSEDCPAILIWTATRVIFVSCYDGSTTVTHVPRHPIDTVAPMPGGG